MAHPSPRAVTTAQFSTEVLASPLPVIVDFWAPWCGPCRSIAPVLAELAEQYAGQVKVVKVNVDDEPSLASQFQIRGIPTILAFVDGRVADQIVGFGGRAPIAALFTKLAAPQESHHAAS